VPDASDSDELKVLAINALFYQAFAQRDLSAMDALWARHEPITCIHPGWNALSGRDDVMSSWRAILGNAASPPIQASSETAHVNGEFAWVLCVESTQGGEVQLVATNLFRLEDGHWRLCHYQAGLLVRTPPEPPRTLN